MLEKPLTTTEKPYLNECAQKRLVVLFVSKTVITGMDMVKAPSINAYKTPDFNVHN